MLSGCGTGCPDVIFFVGCLYLPKQQTWQPVYECRLQFGKKSVPSELKKSGRSVLFPVPQVGHKGSFLRGLLQRRKVYTTKIVLILFGFFLRGDNQFPL